MGLQDVLVFSCAYRNLYIYKKRWRSDARTAAKKGADRWFVSNDGQSRETQIVGHFAVSVASIFLRG
jgi:hypothetical protein